MIRERERERERESYTFPATQADAGAARHPLADISKRLSVNVEERRRRSRDNITQGRKQCSGSAVHSVVSGLVLNVNSGKMARFNERSRGRFLDSLTGSPSVSYSISYVSSNERRIVAN